MKKREKRNKIIAAIVVAVLVFIFMLPLIQSLFLAR